MRSFSSLAVIATSLLVKEAFAGRFDVRKRDVYVETDEVLVTAEIMVMENADGTFSTAANAVIVGTKTVDGSAVLVTSTPSPIPVPSSEPAVFVQATSVPAPVVPTTTSTPKPVSVTPAPTPVSQTPTPSPSTTSTTPPVVPLVVAAAAPVVPTTLVKAPASVAKATTAAAAAPSTITPVSSGGKRGLAFNDASFTNLFTGAGLMSWAYNWGDSTSSIASGLEYVPMLWGLGADHTSSWTSKANAAIASGSTHLLGFNEPDYSGQSNLSPASAASGWKEYMQPYAGKAKLVSPAVTNGGGAMGLNWLSSFISSCSGCTIDEIAIHWYDGGDAKAFKDHVTKAYAAGGNRPVWITEFQAPAGQEAAFLQEVLPWLDSTPMVARYAYFMASVGNMLSSPSSLSTFGKTYATFV